MLDAAEDEGRTPLWFTRANVEPVHPDWEGEGRPASGHVRLAPFDTLAGNVFGYLTYTFCFRTRLDAAKVKEGLRRMLAHYPVLVGQVGLEADGTYGVSWGPGYGPGCVDFTTAASPLSLSDIQLPRGASSTCVNITGVTCSTGECDQPVRTTFHVPTDLSILRAGNPEGDARQYLLRPTTALASFMLCDLAPDEATQHTEWVPDLATCQTPGTAASGNIGHEGGSMLVANIHHLLFDGTSMKQFLEDWAAAARGAASNTLRVRPTSFGRQCWDQLAEHAMKTVQVGSDGCPCHPYLDIMQPPAAPSAPPPAPAEAQPSSSAASKQPPPAPPPMTQNVNLAVYVSGARLAQLRQQALDELKKPTCAEDDSHSSPSHSQACDASQGDVPWVSYNDVLLGRAWQVLGSLPGRSEYGASYPLLLACNLRKRLYLPSMPDGSSCSTGAAGAGGGGRHVHEHLALPHHAVGNWIASVVALPPDAPASSSLGSLAGAVRHAVAASSTDIAPQHVALVHHATQQGCVERVNYRHLPPDHPCLVITVWESAAAPLDFGTGPPVWFQCANPQITNIMAVVPDLAGEAEAVAAAVAAVAEKVGDGVAAGAAAGAVESVGGGTVAAAAGNAVDGAAGSVCDGPGGCGAGPHASKAKELPCPPGAWLYMWLSEAAAQQLLDMQVVF